MAAVPGLRYASQFELGIRLAMSMFLLLTSCWAAYPTEFSSEKRKACAMPPLSQGPLPTNEVSVAEADLAHPPARVAKAPRGKHGAAIALGALALASGVTAGIDAAGSPTDINVGRLAITLTAHGGFKLTPARTITPTTPEVAARASITAIMGSVPVTIRPVRLPNQRSMTTRCPKWLAWTPFLFSDSTRIISIASSAARTRHKYQSRILLE
ncbi:hypothetical protein I546_7246 [Mycobacterium kansasii 732]|nr:hypothetical protein I546_7246 [Mycobacterium kansasii 732]